MPNGGARFWTTEKLAELRRLLAAGKTPDEAADVLDVTTKAVRAQAAVHKIPWACFSNAWTPEVEAKLRELWARTPRLTLAQIREELDVGLTVSRISYKAQEIGLPARIVMAPREKRERIAPSPEAAPVLVAVLPRVVKPVRIAPLPKVAGCPYYDPRVSAHRCGAPGKPYCKEHTARVLPVSRGLVGYAKRSTSNAFLASAL